LHSNVVPASVAENSKLAELEVVSPLGPETIEVSGVTVSTVHVRTASDASTLPGGSTARTWKSCSPSDTLVYPFDPLSHASHGPSSSLHWNFEPPSVDVKEKLGELDGVGPSGPAVIDVSGAFVSTTHERLGANPSFPTLSMARA
jgi:hypothetical protein